MQTPEIVLNNLVKQSKKQDYKFDRLYRILYNPEFYYRAYGKMYTQSGNMTAGSDNRTIDGFNREKIDKTIECLKDLSYQPAPSKRVYIPKKNGKLRPLGIPAIMDKIVQEIVREILEAIYESKFSNFSHGFRPNRSCHTALIDLKTRCTGTKWWIEGDIEGFFDNIDHHVMINILRERIKDEKFLNLIWKFMRAGFLEDWKFHNTYSGTPQGGIVSPILANIYLDKLDSYVEEYANKFNNGQERAVNKEYKKHSNYITALKKRIRPIWDTLSDEKKQEYLNKIKEREELLRRLPRRDPNDPNFRRLKYVRYADDFIIALIGSHEDALNIKADIKEFLSEKLKLTLSDSKTKVTQATKKARFLGYDVFVAKSSDIKKNVLGQKMRSITGHVMLSMPYDCLRKFVFKNGYAKEISHPNKANEWKATPRPGLRHIDDLEIISTYNAELRGFYQYYKYAYDVYRIGNIYNLAYFSFLKTISGKYKTSCQKILANKVKGRNFKDKQNNVGIYYIKKDRSEDFRPFLPNSFKTCKDKVSYEPNIDQKAQTMKYTNSRVGVVARLQANTCEYCGTTKGQMEVHHERRLKDVKGKERWKQIMISRQRKTIVLRTTCHDKLHAGTLD